MAEKKEKNVAKRILTLQFLIAGGLLGWLLYKEIPGAIREVRMWRMANLSSRKH